MSRKKVYILKKNVPLAVRLFTGGPFTGHYKIGKTASSTESRLADARTGSSYPVEVCREYSVGNHHATEAKLHRMFRHRKIQQKGRNEWYYLSPLDLLAIDAYMAGASNIISLLAVPRVMLVAAVLFVILVFSYAVWDGLLLW